MFVRNRRLKNMQQDTNQDSKLLQPLIIIIVSSKDKSQPIYNMDVALVTYQPREDKDAKVEAKTEKQLFNMFTIRKHADFWKTIYSIQSVIQCKLSISHK